jgi:hypothetical protein
MNTRKPFIIADCIAALVALVYALGHGVFFLPTILGVGMLLKPIEVISTIAICALVFWLTFFATIAAGNQ